MPYFKANTTWPSFFHGVADVGSKVLQGPGNAAATNLTSVAFGQEIYVRGLERQDCEILGKDERETNREMKEAAKQLKTRLERDNSGILKLKLKRN
ncbi:hypothetical protein N0V90_005985 [Kalmusia sp. IMI 367209]|nr:hypothetical protein N0V90_005985 [Kalmusia sp. IMI 367209]